MTRNYLAEFDAAVDQDKQTLVNQWIKDEPLEFFKQLRKERPILVTPECVVLSLFDDVYEVLSKPDIFTTRLYLNNIYTSTKNCGHFFAHDKDFFHQREKMIVQSVLKKEDIPEICQFVRESAVDIVNTSQGTLEIVNEYARKVSLLLVKDYIGLDKIELNRLQVWGYWNQYHTFYNHHFFQYSKTKSTEIEKKYKKYSKEFVVYLKKQLLRKWLFIRFLEPFGSCGSHKLLKGDSIVKRLLRISINDKNGFSLLRVGVNIGALLVGSVENISSSVVNSMSFLLAHPEILVQARRAAIKGDRQKIASIVDEIQRFCPITPYLFRHAEAATVIGQGLPWETTVPAGKTVIALTQSAMFDDKCYKNPESFDAGRSNKNTMNYGVGLHECVGKYIAKQVIIELLQPLLHCKHIAAQSAVDYNDSPFPEKYTISYQL